MFLASNHTVVKPNGSDRPGIGADLGPAFEAAQADFLAGHPSFAATAVLDQLRATDYARLDRTGQIYLDYTGGGLYAESQLQQHMALLSDNVFGNPHSNNPTSLAMTHLVEEARAAVLDYFNASPEEYAVIFTANASAALKLVGESYPFGAGGRYLLTYDNHNSVNGIREFARSRGAAVSYLPVVAPAMRVDPAALAGHLAAVTPGAHHLFAYPAQSNFTGVQHPLEWVAQAQALGWDVLLDCAAFAPSNRLDLSQVKPDFAPLSFYKMFGYPTGVGCLLARRSKLTKLRRPWFAGGTITIASVQGEGWHALIQGEAAFEDGTVNYLSLPAVEIGLRHIATIGIDTIHDRVVALADWLLQQMQSLRHSNAAPMVRIFGPTDVHERGANIAFTFLDPAGNSLDYRHVEALAAEQKISLRTGCFCNPGAGEVAHQITRDEMATCFTGASPVSFAQFYQLMQDASGKNPSTIRISLGIASNFADLFRFMQFAESFRDRSAFELSQNAQPENHPSLERDAA